MEWLNISALLLFIIINISAYSASKLPSDISGRIVKILSLILLCGNLLRYTLIYPLVYHIIKIPAEFSTVAYFIVPIILFAELDRISCWAAYSSLMAGFFYYTAMIFAGSAIYGADPAINTAISLLCHGTLYFCGFVTITKIQYTQKEAPKLLAGIGYVVLRAIIIRPIVIDGDGLFIYKLLDAAPIKLIIPEYAVKEALPFYYIIIITLLVLTTFGFFRISEKLYEKFSVREKSQYTENKPS